MPLPACEDFFSSLDLRKLSEIALAEATRRMQRYDPCLLRPRIMPFMAQLAFKVLPRDK